MKRIIQILLVLLGLYFILRMAFYFRYFHGTLKEPGGFLYMLYWGLRLDLASLFYINIPFLLYYLFIDRYLPHRFSFPFSVCLLMIINLPFIAINFIDLGYYGFTARRSSIDLLFVTGDSLGSWPSLLKNYWYLFTGFVVSAVLLGIVAAKLLRFRKEAGKWWVEYRLAIPVLVVFGLLAWGFNRKPLMPSTPLLYFNAELQPLVNNSTFNFLFSMARRQHQLQLKQYYTKQSIDSIFTIKRQYPHRQPFQRRNVVIFILESFCREYFEEGNLYRAHTPFLDSIIAQSAWCNNAFANGTVSNQGIVSVLGSMPALTDEPYFYSMYSNNKIRGLGTIFKEEGYGTHFFMGAGPDHFGFGKMCGIAGIEQYHSKKEFNDDRFYDGNWGIFDHKFLPFAAGVLNKEKKPFLAVLFNISSHHPFTLPPGLHDQFQVPGQPDFLNSISYVDYSLRLFFDSIKNTSWYTNTVFVFTADHSVIGHVKLSFDPYSIFRIPLFLYDPARPVYQNIEKPVQQTDIVPTVLDYLGYSKPFMSFGRSWFDSAYSPAVYDYQGITHVVDSSFILGYNENNERPAYLYDFRSDTALKHNLLPDQLYKTVRERLVRYDKAVIQRFNNSVIRNQLFIQ